MSSPHSGLHGQPRLLASLLAFPVVAGMLVSEARADIDLTGRWRTAPGTYAEIVQTGTAVTLDWDSFSYTGTFDQATLSVSVPMSRYLTMYPYGGGSTLDGALFVFMSTSGSHARFTRCECYDGNETGGDGCDAECRVEPCFTCTPEPSTCTPSADASACDDRDDCTTGETCSAGVCGSATAVEPCVDLTGTWRVASYAADSDTIGEFQAIYEQRDGVVTTAGEIGTVETSTGAFDLVGHGGSVFCSGTSSTFDGTAALDNQRFSGTRYAYGVAASHCVGFGQTIRGRRCDELAGCNITDCTGYADGTACVDADPCTIEEACTAGICSGVPKCSACTTCDSGGTCIPGPRPVCLGTTDATSSRLQILDKDGDDKDQLRWSWSRGEAFDADELDPSGPTDLTLCMFLDDSLFYRTTLSATGSCAKEPCWKGEEGRYSYRNDADASPVTSMSLRSGDAGRSSIKLKGKGAHLLDDAALPTLPLPVPIVTQLQTSTGGCFEAEFEAGGVSRNDQVMFKASGGTPP